MHITFRNAHTLRHGGVRHGATKSHSARGRGGPGWGASRGHDGDQNALGKPFQVNRALVQYTRSRPSPFSSVWYAKQAPASPYAAPCRFQARPGPAPPSDFRATRNPNIQKWVVLRQKIRYTDAPRRSRGPLGSRWPTHLFLVRIRGSNRVHPTWPKTLFTSSSRSRGRVVDYIQIPIKPKISTPCGCTPLRALILTTNKCARWGHPRGSRKRRGATV